MNLLLGRKKHLSGGRTVVFDIGSASVGASILEIDNEGVPSVRFMTRVPLVFQSHFRYERFVTEMFKALDSAQKQVSNFLISNSRKKESIDHVSFVLSAAWYVSKTHLLSFQKEEAFQVTKQLVNRMIARTEEHLKQEDTLERKQKHITNLSIIEKKILSVSLNGYKTSNPYGKEASNINVSLYISFISSDILKKFTDFTQEHFPQADQGLHSHGLSTYITTRDCYSARETFIILDVDGELTNITLVIDDILQESMSIPIGTETLIRSIVKKRKGTPEEARSLILMISQKEGSLDTSSKEYLLLREIGEEWRVALMGAFKKMTTADFYLHDIFLTAVEGYSKWLKDVMENPLEATVEDESKAPRVSVLSPGLIYKLLKFDKAIEMDVPLGIQTFHISRT